MTAVLLSLAVAVVFGVLVAAAIDAAQEARSEGLDDSDLDGPCPHCLAWHDPAGYCDGRAS